MKPVLIHPWSLSYEEAKTIQESLCDHVIREDQIGPINTVAGVDVSFQQHSKIAHAALVLLSFPEMTTLETVVEESVVMFPYIPGLLSFREIPPLLNCFDRLTRKPDVVVCDGHGLAHPRRFGLACHLGVLFNLPSIGVAKTRLVGTHAVVPEERGSWLPLMDEGETIGAALRSRPNTKPIYVSIGHKVSLESAVQLTLNCTTKYRLPETTRRAHRLSVKN